MQAVVSDHYIALFPASDNLRLFVEFVANEGAYAQLAKLLSFNVC